MSGSSQYKFCKSGSSQYILAKIVNHLKVLYQEGGDHRALLCCQCEFFIEYNLNKISKFCTNYFCF